MERRRIFVTGGSGGCGASALSVGLARAFAARGDRVALLDADLSRPSLDLMLGREGTVYHLGDLLAGTQGVHAVAQPLDSGLWFLPGRFSCGAVPHFSAEGLLCEIETALGVDLLVLDTDPLGATLFAPVCDTGILCHALSFGSVSRTAAVRASLESQGARALRLVTTGKHAGADLRGVIDAVGERLLGAVPADTEEYELAYANIAARLSGEVCPIFSRMRARDCVSI